MAYAPGAPTAIYSAAERWVESCLRDDGSLFVPSRRVWSKEVVAETAAPLLDEDLRPLDYLTKLRDQLPGVSDDGLLFTAELLYVHVLPISDMSATAKLHIVDSVLGSMREPVPIPDELLAALTGGVASYGSGMVQRDRYVKWFVRFVEALKALDASGRHAVLSDPWAFREFAHGLGGPALMQREAILHLAFPETFEYALAPDAKRRIVKAFKPLPGVGSATDEDRGLVALRTVLTPVLGERLNLYRHAFSRIWREKAARGWDETLRWGARLYGTDEFDAEERDYKIVVAERLIAARGALSGRGDAWLGLLETAFGKPNNLTHWRLNRPFLDWCRGDREAATALLVAVWRDEGGVDARIDDGDALLPESVLSGPSARLSVLSFLLLAVDSTGCPFYRNAVASGLRRLTGVTMPEPSGLAATYVDFVDLLDELRLRLLLRGVSLRDRLDAQGIAWWLTQVRAPTSWSDADRAAFERFKGSESPKPEPKPVDGTVPEKAWLVRGANVVGSNLVPEWIENGYVSVGWGEIGEIEPDIDKESLYMRVQETYPDESSGSWRGSVGNLIRFLRLIEPGHLVVTVEGDKIYVGRVTGPVADDPAWPSVSARRRTVEWLNGAEPASRAAIQDAFPTLYSRLRTLLTVTDLKEDVVSVAALVGLVEPPAPPKEAALLAITAELAGSIFLPEAWLQEQVVDALAEKRQVIFYGPPGTGKTYVAQKLAEHFTKESGQWELIQFHPSYSYEDFFEGYRPAPTAGGAGVVFELTPGPLRRMAKLAADDSSSPYILIIDEINRGNVPKIFGELLFLLEYRDRQIPLQYSPELPFGLPSNLYVIGTMNTADRSIALIDVALRRRFYFVPFMPSEKEVGGVLRGWLSNNGLDDEPARLLDALNERIAKNEVAIGPSYFMTRDGSAPSLERVWRHAIMPLLEEHYYGTTRQVHEEFGLEKLRAAVAPVAPEESESGEAEPAAGEQ